MPLFREKEVFQDAKYLVWKIDEKLEELQSGIELSDADKKRMKGISHENRLKEFLALRHCLKHLIGPKALIDYSENGKPYVLNSEFSISFSHTDGFAGLILSSDFEVGIDLELPRENIKLIANRFMREEEKQSLSKDQTIEHLLFYWGAKESIVKIEDNKKLDFLKNIEVKPFQFAPNCDTEAYLKLEHDTKLYKLNFETSNTLHISCGKRMEP